MYGTEQGRGPGSAEEGPAIVPRVPHLDPGDRVDAPGGGPGATDPGAAQGVVQQPAGETDPGVLPAEVIEGFEVPPGMGRLKEGVTTVTRLRASS